ncbi:MAG: hypothetical protein K2X35_00820 [Bryobacteraceae bacterium]|nr:hypothetical protein [Bryobacteraceae bacterium]
MAIFFSIDCRYCMASAEFHRTLVKLAQAAKVPTKVFVPTTGQIAKVSQLLEVDAGVVREWGGLSVSPGATPTLAALDHNGKTTALWVGRLPENVEEVVRRWVVDGRVVAAAAVSLPGAVRDYSWQEYQKLRASQKVNLIDPREREDVDETSQALVMPLDEITFRAASELDRTTLQFVDCRRIPGSLCGSAAGKLVAHGLEVATIGAGSTFQSCEKKTQ